MMFGLFFSLLPILTVALPPPWVWRGWVLIFLLLLGSNALSANIGVEDGRAILGLIFLIPYLFITFSLFAVCCIKYYRVKRTVASRGLKIFHVFIFLFAGVIAAAYTIRFAAFFFEGFSDGIFIHTILTGLCGGMAFFLIALSRPRNDWTNTLRMAVFSFTASISTISLLGILLPYVVLKNAADIAKDQPYCIALQKSRRPVENIQDMVFLTMDKLRYGQHAVLLIKTAEEIKAFGWSYLRIPFTDRVTNWDSKNRPIIPCLPEPFFGEKLPLFGKRDNHTTGVFFDEKLLEMNKKYSPKGLHQNYLSISAQAPDFTPVDSHPRTPRASIEIRSRDLMENLHKKYENKKHVGKIGDLTETMTEQQGLRWYYKKDEQNRIATIIGCHASRDENTACQHRFYRDNKMYYFEHSTDLLERSSELENKLYDLFKSFEQE